MPANNQFELVKDVIQVKTILERIDTSVEKLTIISADVTQLLAVHDNRITSQERLGNQLQKQMDKINDTNDKKLTDLSKKIDENRQDILDKLDDYNKVTDDQHDEIKSRMAKIERWMWSMVGGGATVVFLLEKFPNLFHF